MDALQLTGNDLSFADLDEVVFRERKAVLAPAARQRVEASRAVVERLGLPITATSANLHGAAECTNAACVRDQIGDRVPLIVDGGPTGRAQPTTIVDLSLGPGRWLVLREGAIPTHEIVMVLQR